MTTPIEYALMAGAAYDSTRKEPNKIPWPDGWSELGKDKNLNHRLSTVTGFEAVAFVKDKNIVVSFAGTFPGMLDFGADLLLGAGVVEGQLTAAAVYYQDIKKAYPESDGFKYTFTGHSLGGGLAALMGVFFNKPAFTFDPAPFRASATMSIAKQLSSTLGYFGYASDKELDAYLAFTVGIIPLFIRGENRVVATAVAGEFLSVPFLDVLRIRAGGTDFINHGNVDQGGVLGMAGFGMNVLHAQTLLIALKQSAPLQTATFVMPYLIPDLFDENLFAKDANQAGQQDLLSLLVRREYGVPGGGPSDTDLLTKFGQDMLALATSGSAGRDIRQYLEKIAFAYYYGQESGDTELFFDEVSGGLRFDLNGVTLGNAQAAYDNLKTWLTTNAPSEAADQLSNLDDYDRFTLALDTSLSAESPSDDKADFMFSGANGGNLDGGGGNDLLIGRAGADTLKGGSGEDKLYGGSGNDILEGGKGADTLNGGAGYDTYIWNEGDGSDKITDSDGQGHIEIRQADGSTRIVGGQLIKEESGNTWTSSDGQLTLKQGQGWTLTTQSGATLTLEQYKDGDYGLHLNGTPAKDKPTTQTLIGDKKPDITGTKYRYDEDGNLIVTEEDEADRRDYLAGSYDRNDRIEGRGGNDFIDADSKGEGNSSDDQVKGEGGDDILWGNEGRDRLEGGAGKDWLDGGPGDDKLYADKETKLADANVQQGTGGQPGDWLNGNDGDDTLIGDKNDDLLMGGPGKDILAGGGGNDTLYGGWGADYASVRIYRPESDQEPDKPNPFPELQWSIKRKIKNGDTYETTFEITKHTSFTALSFYQDKDDTKGDALYGGAGDDWIMSGEGDDYAEGGDGDDAVFGEAGNDILNGGKGKDVLVGDNPDRGSGEGLPGARHGDDALSGGEGDDRLGGNGGNDMLSGGAGNDQIQGDDSATPGQYHGNDTLDGGEGNDKLWGNGGDDILAGGAGDDHLEGDYSELDKQYHGNDLLDGGDGNDALTGEGGNDFLSGGKGDDRMWGDGMEWVGDDMLDGGEGDDTLYGGGGKDYLAGGKGKDQIAGDTGDDGDGDADIIDGGEGDDQLCGQGGDDMIEGGEGNDQIAGGHGADQLSGGAGDDEIAGDTSEDDDQGGNDLIDGGAGDDLLCGFTGNDQISGGEGNDRIGGGKGDDILDGGEGNNIINGGEGNDILFGGSGDDTYCRGAGGGTDTIHDAGGEDRLIFELRTGFDLNDPDYAVKMYNAIQQHVRLGLGSMLLQIDDGGAVHIADFDPETPYGQEGIEWFQFDQMVLSKKELIDLLGFEIEGTPEADVLSGTALGDTITALEGDDSVYGLGGDDSIQLDAGDDWADGGEGADYIEGAAGNDILLGNGGDDQLYGDEGDDQLAGDAGADTLSGGTGNDMLAGGTGADILDGGEGNDVLAGGAGTDILFGGDGNNTYEYAAGWGNDTAYAGPGSDTIRLTDLALNDIQLHRQANDLLILVNADKGTFTAVGWFDPASGFDRLELSDGSVLDRAAVEASLYRNTAPLTTDDVIAMSEHGAPMVTGNVLDNDSDDHSAQGPGVVTSTVMTWIGPVDIYSYTNKLTVETPGTYRGSYGTFSLGKDGGYTYVLDSNDLNVQLLAQGQTLDEYFDYRVSDNDPWAAAETSGQIHVMVNGENDPPFSVADTLMLQEDHTLEASGNVLDNDADPDAGATLSVLNPGVYAGTYGTLTLAADGGYTYTLANDTRAVQSLGRYEAGFFGTLSTGWDVFSYEVSDGTTSIPEVQIVVRVDGDNDAPVLNLPAPDQTVEPGTDWSFTRPEDMFGDIDVGDTLNYTYQISSPDGTPTDWINYDADTGTLSGTAPDDADGTIEITVVADDGISEGEGQVAGLETPYTFTLILPQPEVVPVPDTPDPVETPVVEVTVATVDPTPVPVELPPGDPATPEDSPMPADIIPAGGVIPDGEDDGVSSSRTLAPSSAPTFVPTKTKPVYSIHIHTPVTQGDGTSCDCRDTGQSADPLLAGIASKLAYGEGLMLNGGNEAELLVGEGGDDLISGGEGGDMLIGGLGRDRIQGEDGDDQIAGDKGGLDESGDDDLIDGGSGNDLIAGQGGNDTVDGGEGDDVIDGGEGHDLLSGNLGDDRLQGGAGSDWLRGEDGDDVLFGETGNDLLDGGAGKDTLLGGSGEDRLLGGDGDDTLLGGDCTDVIEGNAGNDEISGGTGHDRIDGGEGDDVLFGDGCNDTLTGGAGKDQLQGGTGLDQLDGGDGDDVLFGEDDNDILLGGAGDDYLEGDSAEAELTGDDRLDGGDGNDTLLGNAGDDELSGGAGDDKLQGGAGDDALRGGEGDDVYFFAAGKGNDHIADSSGSDWLVLEDLNFDDILDLDTEARRLVFKDGSELYLDDLNPSDLMAEGGIEYIQFADKTVMSRQALIQEFVPPPGSTPGELGMGAKDSMSGNGDKELSENDFTPRNKDTDKAGAILWFASARDYQEPAYIDLTRLAASSSAGVVLGTNGAGIMAQWLAMDAALAAHLAREGAANDADSGAETSGGTKFIGSATPWGRDPLSLAVSGSDIPKTFHGLNEGFGRIAG